MANKFGNKRHKELKQNFAGPKTMLSYFESLAEQAYKSESKEVPESLSFSQKRLFGQTFYEAKVEEYVKGFEDGSYLKTDLPVEQRVAYNITHKF